MIFYHTVIESDFLQFFYSRSATAYIVLKFACKSTIDCGSQSTVEYLRTVMESGFLTFLLFKVSHSVCCRIERSIEHNFHYDSIY